jgi:hypothetical protein
MSLHIFMIHLVRRKPAIPAGPGLFKFAPVQKNGWLWMTKRTSPPLFLSRNKTVYFSRASLMQPLLV